MSKNLRKHTQYGNTWYGWKGAQHFVISKLEKDEFPIAQVTARNGRLWGGLKFEKLLKLIKKDHGLYEIIPNDWKRKVYFDFDDEYFKSIQVCKDFVLKYLPNARMQISGRQGSIHIVVSNYYANSNDDMWQIRELANAFKTENGVDNLVYTDNRLMKIINQSKQEKGKEPKIQSYIEGSTTLSKHLIMHDFDEDAIDVSTLEIDLPVVKQIKKLNIKQRKEKLDILSIPQQNLTLPDNFDLENASPTDKLTLLPCPPRGDKMELSHDVVWRVMVWCKQVGISWNSFWNWTKNKDNGIEYYHSFDKQWKYSEDYRVKNDTIDLILERFYPTIRQPVSAKIMRRQFEEAQKFARQTDGEFLSANDITNAKFTALISSMFTNKTGSVVDFLLAVASGKKVIWLTPRITLAQNTLARLLKAGITIVNYKDYTTEERRHGIPEKECDNVIWSIQSLFSVTRDYDLVILDEIETLLTTFAGDCNTHKNKLINNWDIFLSLLTNAPQTIVMDALYSNLTHDLLTDICKDIAKKGEKATIDVVTTKPRKHKREMLEYLNYNTWLKKIIDQLEEGKNVFVYVPYKTGEKGVAMVAEIIRKHFNWTDNDEIVHYYSDKEEEKKRLVNIEKEWINKRCVVTNGCISVGVNFDIPNIFESVHVHITPNCPLRDAFQAIGRIRRPISRIIYMYRDKRCFHGKKIDVDLPDCPIFRKLRKNIMLETNATKSCQKRWDVFELFLEQTGITMLPVNKDKISEKSAEYIKELIGETDCVFEYDMIKNATYLVKDNDGNMKEIYMTDAPEEVINKWEIRMWSSDVTLDERLQYLKFRFHQKINETPSLENQYVKSAIKQLWNKDPTLVDKVIKMKMRNEDYLINRLFAENKIDMDDYDGVFAFPSKMSTSIPLDKIKEHFHFHNPPRDYSTSLVSRMINSYFGNPVYAIKTVKDPINKNKRSYIYDTNSTFGENFGFAWERVTVKKKKKFNILDKDDEDDEDEIIKKPLKRTYESHFKKNRKPSNSLERVSKV